MSQDDLSPDRGTTDASDARERIEAAVELLRREWRDGCNAGTTYQVAMQSVRRLGSTLPPAEAAELHAIVTDLERYDGLTVEQRRATLAGIADRLKRLAPRLPRRAPTPRPAAPERPPLRQPAARDRGTAPPASRLSTSLDHADPPVSRPIRVTARVAPLSPEAPVTALKGAGGATSKKLAKLGVETVGDLLLLAPRRYIDYSRTIQIGKALALRPGEDVTVRGRITDLQVHRGPGAPRVVIKLADQTGWMRVTWFNQYLANAMHVGEEIIVSGTLEQGPGPLAFTGPEWERASTDGDNVSTGRIVPVYPLTSGLAQKSMRNFTRQALDVALGGVEDYLPPALLEPLGGDGAIGGPLPVLADAIAQVHYPESEAQLKRARLRLAFDDLLLLQLGLVRRKVERRAFTGTPIDVDANLIQCWQSSLPFTLTGAQESALREIFTDLGRDAPMARLLQGDVGSGKTAVAAGAMLAVVGQGYQAALMAPTELLAEQHLAGLTRLYEGLPEEQRPKVALLTGATKGRERKTLLAQAGRGEIDILVGTHALIQDGVELPKQVLSIVDEQHRFGVRQRASLSGSVDGMLPHQLGMTATPIPRTLNMVLHGDLDVSVLAERPPGRSPIITARYLGVERSIAYDLVREQVGLGRQVFVICPLVEASDVIEAKAAVDEAHRLQSEIFPELRVAVLHGRMKAREKDAIMEGFRNRDADLLVSTSVIEVGIDVPNATVMIIEGADRFGLAQLHQFRGRVGRGSAQSYCLLLAENVSADGEARLETMVESDDGFLLAERDLELRGPGDFIGTRQSGLPEMTWLEGGFDTRLLERARRAAENVLAQDPELAAPHHARLRARFTKFWERAAPEKAV
ncbi:MAG: ATP-dependent DNA helicase RecG [Thermomicrobiales bacterium]